MQGGSLKTFALFFFVVLTQLLSRKKIKHFLRIIILTLVAKARCYDEVHFTPFFWDFACCNNAGITIKNQSIFRANPRSAH